MMRMGIPCCGGGRGGLTVNGLCFESTKSGQATVRLVPDSEFYKIDWGDGAREVQQNFASHIYPDGSSKFICIEPFAPFTIVQLFAEHDGLVGPLPALLFQFLPALAVVRLGNNNLSGSIPPEIAELTGLATLRLEGNNLSGSIPPEIAVSSLRRLWLSSNSLSGSIPPELGNTALTELRLNANSLSGSIPPELGSNLNLERLWLNDNSLSGPIPSQTASMSALSSLFLHNNDFSNADLSDFVGNLWASRSTLGANSASIQLQGNNGLAPQAIDQIEGTGAYAGDGLVQAGCIVTYS